MCGACARPKINVGSVLIRYSPAIYSVTAVFKNSQPFIYLYSYGQINHCLPLRIMIQRQPLSATII